MDQQINAGPNVGSAAEQQIKTGPIMAALLVAGFVGLFSETALNIALGELSSLFQTNATTIQWLATGYFLTLGILVPVTGIMMQKFTTRQMFLTSIFLTLAGTILAASAPVCIWSLAGRACYSSRRACD